MVHSMSTPRTTPHHSHSQRGTVHTQSSLCMLGRYQLLESESGLQSSRDSEGNITNNHRVLIFDINAVIILLYIHCNPHNHHHACLFRTQGFRQKYYDFVVVIKFIVREILQYGEN